MPKRKDIKKIMVIGSGPIVIGQAAEFDYAGTQACLALKEEGYEVILVNSNPATIMTDTTVADKVYMEPLTLEYVAKILRFERPDALIPGLGGQTGLNLAMQLEKKGVLSECQVELLGTSAQSIECAEDREKFKELCESLGEPVLPSMITHSAEEAVSAAEKIGYPVVLRPAFTLGGTGGGFADNEEQLREIMKNALRLSPVRQVLVEKSIRGFKEIEYEVVRDANDTAIAVCNMENLDPVGIHTGDSIVVAPSQTLTNKEYQLLRDSALKIIRALKIEGGCNVQFALDPQSFDYFLIEVNPRVSRSSALASKASGYPIARVSAKIAVGMRLDEIMLANTPACFEPALDYVVTKIARFPFDKFATAPNVLSTQMKATGEVMSIGRTMEESLLKAVRSLEIGASHLELKKFDAQTAEELAEYIKTGRDDRIFAMAQLMRLGCPLKRLYELTKIDMFFLDKIKNIVDFEGAIKSGKRDLAVLREAKRMGFCDEYDYSTVHAIKTIRDFGYEAIIINNNPETVSTDYTTADKLYFEPLTTEDVLNVLELEKPLGVIASLGGQTAINLADKLKEFDVNIIGTGVEAIERAENRDSFEKILKKLNIPQPEGYAVTKIEDGVRAANEIGYPVLVRPSFVLGGRAMQIVGSDDTLRHYLENAVRIDEKQPVLVDKYIVGKECEVDAVCDGTDVFVPGIMELIERTGIHSGDSISVYPSFSLSRKVKETILDYTLKLGKGIGIVGLYNIQFIVDKDDNVFVIEVNPRSSRTVPFLSKATGFSLADIATLVMLGKSLKEQGLTELYPEEKKKWYVKVPVFSFSKIHGLDAYLSPEMKSTGEAIGYDEKFTRALYKALQASGMNVVNYGTVFVTIADKDKDEAFPLIERFYRLGFNIEATTGTAKYLKSRGIKTRAKKKISDGSEEILDSIRKGYVNYVINTRDIDSVDQQTDGFQIRRCAVENNVTMFTALETVRALLDVLEEITITVSTIDS